MNYRIIYKKEDSNFYIQKLITYKTWFGLGKEKEKWVYIKKWYDGSYYPPYSDDTLEPHFFKTKKSAKTTLKEIIKKDKLKPIEVVYSSEEKNKTNPYLHSVEWDCGIPKN